MRFAISSLVLSAGLVLPFSANAVLITISYSGNVTADFGHGYSIGDSISGSLSLDTALLPPDSNLSPDNGIYAGGNFLSGYVPPGATGSNDYLGVQDQAYGGTSDRFEVVDFFDDYVDSGGGNTHDLQGQLALWATDLSLDFVQGDSPLQSFTLTAADGLDDFAGNIVSQEITTVDGISTPGSYFRITLFSLNALTVSSATTVPEPGTMMLLFAGLLGTGLARRRRSIDA